MELKAYIRLYLYCGLYKLKLSEFRNFFLIAMDHLCTVLYCFVIVLHLFYTICPLMMKVHVLKDEKRTGLLQFVSFLRNSMISACWSYHLVTIYYWMKLFILCECRYCSSSSSRVSRRSAAFFSNP